MRHRNPLNLRRSLPCMSWSPKNLYNLWRRTVGPESTALTFKVTTQETLFQQRWRSKAAVRAYHGEYIPEKVFKRWYLPDTLPDVRPHRRVFADDKNDLEEYAKRRTRAKELERKQAEEIELKGLAPVGSLMFMEVERRLDVFLFRCCFVHSVYEARRLIIHGYVKLNGKKHSKANTRLAPGDMVSVDPDAIRFLKPPHGPVDYIVQQSKPVVEETPAEPAESEETSESEVSSALEAEAAEALSSSEANVALSSSEADMEAAEALSSSEANVALSSSEADMEAAEALSSSEADVEPAEALSSSEADVEPTEALSSSEADVEAASELPAAEVSPTSTAESASTSDNDPPSEANAETDPEPTAEEEAKKIVLRASTPFHLPQYASPWLFIPAYIEVSFKTCSAVYVRHPTARPGYSEIPTPYDADGAVIRYAWEWYVHRRPRMRSQSQLARMPEDRVITLQKEKIVRKDRRSFKLNKSLYMASERPWRSSTPPHMDVAAGVGIGKRTLAEERDASI